MTTKHAPATPLPWRVNAIDSKRGRITGDETSTGWDKLDVHGANANVARIYRPNDARFIAHACNEYPKLIKDAARYRWLRKTPNIVLAEEFYGDRLDDEIDAALMRELGEE